MTAISKRTDWNAMKSEVAELIARLQQRPRETKDNNIREDIVSILVAYREGDLTLAEAREKFLDWRRVSVRGRLLSLAEELAARLAPNP